MEKVEFFQYLLGITSDWEVKEVKVNKEVNEIDILIEYKPKLAMCPVTNKMCPIYDLRENRRWRHLNIMQYQTYLNCRIPRVINEDDKISTIEVPWSDYSQRYTYLFEESVIKVLQSNPSKSKGRSIADDICQRRHIIILSDSVIDILVSRDV